MVATAMAARKKPGPKPDPSKARSAYIQIRCTPAWKEWLGRFAVQQGSDISDVVDEALLRFARDEGFEMPPKR